MPTDKILNEDWTDYDNRKIKDYRDQKFFACTENWEVNYLKNKIKKLYPNVTDEQILTAIHACCKSMKAPYPRAVFVKCVAERLGLK